MRIGTSLNSTFSTDDVRQGARWMIERTVASREAGLDSLFVGDHHVTGVPYYQNTAIMGRLLAEWGDRTAGALYLLPLWHPVLVAEQVGTLAAIAEGPFVLQCAIGGGPPQFAGMGMDMRRRVRDFEASLDIITRLLSGERVTAAEPFPIQDAVVSPRPPEPAAVWIGADAEQGIGRAARLGDAWYAGPGLTLDQAREKLDHYRAQCATHGRTPDTIPIRRDIYVGDGAADVERVTAPILAHGHRGFEPGALAVGTPDEVAAHFRALADMGYTDVIVRQLGVDQPDALASIARLKEVREAIA